MNQLRESLILADARASGFHRIPIKDSSTIVVNVRGPLTKDIASVLRCLSQVYNLNGNPYPGLSALDLDHEIASCEFSVPSHPRLRPTIATGFKIVPCKLSGHEGELELHFRMKFGNDDADALHRLVNAVIGRTFDMALEALQGGLFDQPEQTAEKKADGPAGGRRVAMSAGGQEEAPPPIVQAVMDGQKAEDAIAAAEEGASSGTLASRLHVAGGTTADLPGRRRKGRTFDDSVLPVEEPQPVH